MGAYVIADINITDPVGYGDYAIIENLLDHRSDNMAVRF